MRFVPDPARVGRYVCVALFAPLALSTARAQQPATTLGVLDLILYTYVRDGYVYYRALKSDRRRLDAYVSAIGNADVEQRPKEEQIAFWLNAYNTLVLRTVIDHYPALRRLTDYPQGSIRQTPGAFERVTYRVAGRMLTLDKIEQTILSTYDDPRLYFAIGRGSAGGGRLRSEAYSGALLEKQLAEVASECLTRAVCIQIDSTTNPVNASSIFLWREKDFVAAYADKAAPMYAARIPIERAILGFVQPKLLQTERDFMEKNDFRLVYEPFDWSLNDLTGRGDR